jgi:hypothetical protein
MARDLWSVPIATAARLSPTATMLTAATIRNPGTFAGLTTDTASWLARTTRRRTNKSPAPDVLHSGTQSRRTGLPRLLGSTKR